MQVERRFPTYKFLVPAYADQMLEAGIVRIGTLHEYRDKEKYDAKTVDPDEGKRIFDIQGPLTLDSQTAGFVGLGLLCPGEIAIEGTVTATYEWPNCHIYCMSGDFFTSTLRQSLEDGKTSCVAILDPVNFISAVTSSIESIGQPILLSVLYGPRRIEVSSQEELQQLGRVGIPPFALKSPEYSDQAEVRAAWFESKIAIEPVVARIPGIMESLLRLDFQDVDIEHVLDENKLTRIGVRLIRKDGDVGDFSTLLPEGVFTLVVSPGEDGDYLALTPQSGGHQFYGSRFMNVGGLEMRDITTVAAVRLADLDRLEFYSEDG